MFKGRWKTFNDTLILYSDGNDLSGDEIKNNYAYSYGHSDSIKNEIQFGIYDLRSQSITGYRAILYYNNLKKSINFNSDGKYTLQATDFDSLIIQGDKYFKYQVIKITLPVCCYINNFRITPGIRCFLFDERKIKNLEGHVIYKRK